MKEYSPKIIFIPMNVAKNPYGWFRSYGDCKFDDQKLDEI